ncbi:MAG: FAD-dependent monooxygenase [Patulibacter sp.]|nr:FAD-dependent monooxygenase [Patulibacter sp.]
MRVAEERAERSEDESVRDADVIVVGGGPVGLMLAAELRLADVRPLVLERQPRLEDAPPNANGLGGQVIELLRYRGLLDRFTAAATAASPPPIYPFGGVHLDLTDLADPPLRGLQLQHPSVDRLLDERAVELGAEVRRGHRVVAIDQDDAVVAVDVEGPDGRYRLTAAYLVGCDGAYSRIREMAGIAFPGVTYPEVNRLAELTVPESVTVLDDGALDVPGVGRVDAGYTRTEHGVFAMGMLASGVLMIQTIEEERAGYDHEAPVTVEDLGESIRRVLGFAIPLGVPRRLSRYQHHARQADRYRAGRVLLAGDAAHVLPATGVARSVGMLDAVNLAWKLAAAVQGSAPDGLLDSYHAERHFAGARALLQTQAQVALRRGDDDAADALREVFRELLTDEQPQHRLAAMIAGADIRYPVASPGAGRSTGAKPAASDAGRRPTDDRHPLAGAFAPAPLLRAVRGSTGVAESMRAARPILLVLGDHPELREVAQRWWHHVDTYCAEVDDRPADALLIRPDAHVAWAAALDEAPEVAERGLRDALGEWFGAP